MSFSGEVKEELLRHISPSRHCQIAELAAIILYCGKLCPDDNGRLSLQVQTENQGVVRKCFTLLRKTFNINNGMVEEQAENRGKSHTTLILGPGEQLERVLHAVKLYDSDNKLRRPEEGVNPLILKNSCCQRAFLRDAFVCIGSMSDPAKSYHLEFVCGSRQQALQLQSVIQGFQVEAKIVRRKKYQVVYLKEGSGIVDLLNIMEAHVCLMNLENLRILKEMRNSINRKVNCEAANITKTVNAAARQTEDILLIRERYGFQHLPEGLREIAEVRLEYPDATLKELGQYLDPPVGKSGVNHRLRKLSELADRMRT